MFTRDQSIFKDPNKSLREIKKFSKTQRNVYARSKNFQRPKEIFTRDQRIFKVPRQSLREIKDYVKKWAEIKDYVKKFFDPRP